MTPRPNPYRRRRRDLHVESIAGAGPTVFEHACRLGAEGHGEQARRIGLCVGPMSGLGEGVVPVIQAVVRPPENKKPCTWWGAALACADVGHSLCDGPGWVDLLGVAQPQPRGQFPTVGRT
jgi:hypothetical protein